MARHRPRRPRSSTEQPLLDLPFRQPRPPRSPYDWLSADALERLHDASLTILETVGIDFLDDEALDLWQRAGGQVDRTTQRVRIDRDLLLPTIAAAPASFRWRARNPAHDVVIGGGGLAFGPCGGMAYATDLDRGPVSYTHLRAHETVLDIVCRLMLEKTNNTTHTHNMTV